MRHRKAGRKLGRSSSHRKAMFRNMAMSLIEHGRIKTTLPKAKELRRIVEKLVTWGTSLGDLLDKDPKDMTPEERAKVVHHYRMARRMVPRKDVLSILFREVAPLYKGRAGGYTRIVKGMTRHGDNAPTAIIELIGYEPRQAEEVEEEGEE